MRTLIWSVYRKLFSLKEEYFVFGASLLFYLFLYFSSDNKTLLGLFVVFLLIFFKRFKSLFLALFLSYLLFLPFDKGKTFEFTLIPAWILRANVSYNFYSIISFADLAFLGMIALFFRKRLRWSRKGVSANEYFLLGFLLFSLVSVFFSQFATVSLAAFLRLVRLAAVFFVIQELMANDRIKKFLPMVLSATLLFEGLWSSLQFLFQGPLGRAIEPYGMVFSDFGYLAAEESTFFRAQGTWEHPNSLGAFAAILSLFFVAQVFRQDLSSGIKKIYWISLIGGLFALTFSASRVSWAIFALMTIFIFAFFAKKGVKIYFPKRILIGGFLLGTVFAPFLILPRLGHLYITLSGQGGLYYRGYLLQKAWDLAQGAPLGIGLGTFPAVLVQKFGFFTWPAPVHNLLLEILVEAGIFSLVFFLLFLISSYKKYFTNYKKLSLPDLFLKTGAMLAGLAFIIIAQFYPFFVSSRLFEYFWLFLGVMIY
ncbi:MAG: O-antigen ligase family protein [bacterium]|nr:O-antigen ligase family protein [bacterium]